MNIVIASGRILNIRWMHSSYNGETRPDAGAFRRGLDETARREGRRMTLCEIAEIRNHNASDGSGHVDEVFNVLGQGMAVCHPNDQFRKSMGRKVSLTAAMTAAGLDYNEREAVWDNYRAEFETKGRVVKLDQQIQAQLAGRPFVMSSRGIETVEII